MALGGTLYGALHLLCTVWVIYDVYTSNKKLSDGSKILWTVAAVVFGVLTAIVYYFFGRKK